MIRLRGFNQSVQSPLKVTGCRANVNELLWFPGAKGNTLQPIKNQISGPFEAIPKIERVA